MTLVVRKLVDVTGTRSELVPLDFGQVVLKIGNSLVGPPLYLRQEIIRYSGSVSRNNKVLISFKG